MADFTYPYSQDVTLKEGTHIENESLNIERIDGYLKGAGGFEASNMLNSAVVYAYGNSAEFGAKNYPILFRTQGMGNKKAYESFDNQVRNYMLGKPKKTSVIGKTVYGDSEQPGIRHTEFDLYFRDNHFTAGEIITKGTLMRNYQIQLQGKGVPEGGLFKFRGKIFGNTSSFIPPAILRSGEAWGDGPYKVSLEHSRGNENRTYTPFPITNTLSLIRQSINVAGNASNKKMNFTITADSQTFTMYYDWEKHLTNLQFMAVKEADLLMSKQTKDKSGYIHNVDINSGKFIPSGNGVIGQIPKSNILSYTRMTTRKMDTFLTDVMQIAGTLTQDSNAVIDVMGGFDLLTNIDTALKKSTSMLPLNSVTNDTYVRKGQSGLQFGAYFTEYKHISGVIFRFTHHNFFDESPLALTSARNPITNRSVLSSEGIIMNFGKVSFSGNNGESKEASNIEYMYEKGREYIEGTIRGMAAIEGKQGGDIVTDVDASSMQMMVSQGAHVYAPLSLGYIQFNLRNL